MRGAGRGVQPGPQPAAHQHPEAVRLLLLGEAEVGARGDRTRLPRGRGLVGGAAVHVPHLVAEDDDLVPHGGPFVHHDVVVGVALQPQTARGVRGEGGPVHVHLTGPLDVAVVWDQSGTGPLPTTL